MRRFRLAALFLCLAATLPARQQPALCGTTRETPKERLFLHRQAVRRARPRAVTPAPRDRDSGNIAIIQDSDGIVARQNEFNLNGQTLRFTPSSAGYRYEVLNFIYDPATAPSGTPLAALDDDDARLVPLPFAFPFYGATYREVYVNSDGNLTFTASDTASTDRSLGRATAGPPRISPLFDDLNPAQTAGGVRVLSQPGRLTVSWTAVPEWVSSGSGPSQTFSVTLYPDGRIEFSYLGADPTSAVVGIAPGNLKGSSTLVDFRNDPSSAYTGAIAERFGNTLSLDIVTVAQHFYQTHEDAYDYLVIYNNMDIPALSAGVIAYESTVRSRGEGYGVEPIDDGAQYGSAARLHAVLNLGPLSQYPVDPNALVPARASAGDTPITTIAHETGHLFLAYSSVRDPNDPSNLPMLGYQNQHWGFFFNSEASLLEGERIQDNGPGASPRFLTTDTVQQYAPLDQYLMGWRALDEVPDTFFVTGAPPVYRNQHPLRGVAFDGIRRDVSAAELAQAMGRRTPDSTVAQRRFRFAFVLVTAAGADPSAADIARLESYRAQFESFFAQASGGRASADASLKRAVQLSIAPAAGVAVGATATAAISVATPPIADLRIALQTSNGSARFPSSATIPVGANSAHFSYTGVASGVEELTAVPADPAYEIASARIQVAGAAELKLIAISSNPIVVRLSDANGLVYSGVRLFASASAGGAVAPASVSTDAQGLATFRWTPGPASSNQLQLSVDGMPSVSLALRAGLAVPVISSVVNAASYVEGIAAGALQSILGENLFGSTVTLDGAPLPASYVSDRQINFLVPESTPLGSASLAVHAPSGETASRVVSVAAVQPGIFGVRLRDDGILEIYCTGLGPTAPGVDGLAHTTLTPTVFVGAAPVQPLYSGLVRLSPGLYQINVRLPSGSSGPRTLLISVNLEHSNEYPLP